MMVEESYDVDFLVNKVKENVAVLTQCYEESEADGDELAELLEQALEQWARAIERNQNLINELARVAYFMNKRIDISGECTVLEYYDSLDKDLIDRKMMEEWL